MRSVDNLVSYQYLKAGLINHHNCIAQALFCLIKCHPSKTRQFGWAPAIPTGMLVLHGKIVGVVLRNTGVHTAFHFPPDQKCSTDYRMSNIALMYPS